jgi:5-methylcytosine-specific restriction endonuclease McrA
MKKRYKKREETDNYSLVKKQVLKRDKNKCQFPTCKKRSKLQVHHIIRHADCIALRENRLNLITLCEYHHKFVTGKEMFYIELFKSIVFENEDNYRF